MNVIYDGNNILVRMMHVPDLVTIRSKRGVPIGGIVGVLRGIPGTLQRLRATRCWFVWDAGISERRKKLLSQYKNRVRNEEFRVNLGRQRDILTRLLPMVGIDVVSLPGHEADDVMAALALSMRKLDSAEEEVTIVSTDADMLQCVHRGASVYQERKDGNRLVTEKNFQTVTGVPSDRYLLFKAVVGDPSDCILGVRGVGPKTISAMIEKMMTPYSLELFMLSQEGKSVKVRRVAEEFSTVKRNLELMDLSKEEFTSEEIGVLRSHASYIPHRDFDLVRKAFRDLGAMSMIQVFHQWSVQFMRLGL